MRTSRLYLSALRASFTGFLLLISSGVWGATSPWGFLDSPLNYGHLYAGSSSGAVDWDRGNAFGTLGLSSGYQWPIANFGSLAMELNFSTSFTGGDLSQAPNGNPLEGSADFQSMGADALYRSKGALYGLVKIGFYQNDTDYHVSNSSQNISSMNRKYNAGLGVGWKPIPSIPINLELIYSSVTSDSNLTSLRLLWHFKRQPPKLPPYLLSEVNSETEAQQTISSLATTQQSEAEAPQASQMQPEPRPQTNPVPAEPELAEDRNMAPSEPPNRAAVTTKLGNRDFGKSLYNAERTAKSAGCRTPEVSLIHTSWPKETYQAVCSGGDYHVISCEWGSCRVLK